jgi:hypothetical protein
MWDLTDPQLEVLRAVVAAGPDGYVERRNQRKTVEALERRSLIAPVGQARYGRHPTYTATPDGVAELRAQAPS